MRTKSALESSESDFDDSLHQDTHRGTRDNDNPLQNDNPDCNHAPQDNQESLEADEHSLTQVMPEGNAYVGTLAFRRLISHLSDRFDYCQESYIIS